MSVRSSKSSSESKSFRADGPLASDEVPATAAAASLRTDDKDISSTVLFSCKKIQPLLSQKKTHRDTLPLGGRRLSRRVANLPKGTPGAAVRDPQVGDRTRGHNPLQIVDR